MCVCVSLCVVRCQQLVRDEWRFYACVCCLPCSAVVASRTASEDEVLQWVINYAKTCTNKRAVKKIVAAVTAAEAMGSEFCITGDTFGSLDEAGLLTLGAESSARTRADVAAGWILLQAVWRGELAGNAIPPLASLVVAVSALAAPCRARQELLSPYPSPSTPPHLYLPTPPTPIARAPLSVALLMEQPPRTNATHLVSGPEHLQCPNTSPHAPHPSALTVLHACLSIGACARLGEGCGQRQGACSG